MELLRGDSFVKQIKPKGYKLKPGDKIHIAVMKNAYSEEYLHEQVIEIQEETDGIIFEILPSETDNFPINKLLLDIVLTYGDGIVKTNQYSIEMKADGIHG